MDQQSIVSVDAGGTFCDFVFVSASGSVAIRKRASTPDPGDSVMAGIEEALADGLILPGFLITHGSTVAVNALLERRGARAALITTAGFRDVLEIARQNRDNLYGLAPRRDPALIPAELRFEVHERTDWRGEVLVPLDIASAEHAIDLAVAAGVESIAVCLLFSFLREDHERTLGRMAAARGLTVSLSCEVAPESGEYERSATTAANAMVAPVVASYLRRLASRLNEVGCARFRVMHSGAGTLSPDRAADHAIRTVLSGPAGGVLAASRLAKRLSLPRILTFDMGGTSTDVAMVIGGECPVVTESQTAGIPIRTPVVDIHTVGAGGGSIVRVDVAGALRVGPQSAGAAPGPVAYGHGSDLTVTDAHVLLGRIPATLLLAGGIALDVDKVRTRFADLAARLGCTPERAALAVLEVAEAAMARALRRVSAARGHDPADFTLVSFGGAGGLHACGLAEALGTSSVLLPRYPGAFSAIGLALAEMRADVVRTLPAGVTGGEDGGAGLRAYWRSMEEQASAEMAACGLEEGCWVSRRFVDLRYVGQSFSIGVPCEHGIENSLPAFHEAHRARYGHADERERVECVALRLTATERRAPPALLTELPTESGAPQTLSRCMGRARWQDVPVYRRDTLAAGQKLAGPALVIQLDATTYLPEGWRAEVDTEGNLRAAWHGSARA